LVSVAREVGTPSTEVQVDADGRRLRPRFGRSRRVDDQFEVRLDDDDLLSEVELTTNLIIAATASDERLPQSEIDRILGVVPKPVRSAPTS
jgi:hypothetical protein